MIIFNKELILENVQIEVLYDHNLKSIDKIWLNKIYNDLIDWKGIKIIISSKLSVWLLLENDKYVHHIKSVLNIYTHIPVGFSVKKKLSI